MSATFFYNRDAAIAFCFKHLNLSGKIEGLRRKEKLEIPIVALREAIINSLAHRAYENRGTSTGLAIYDDRVEIENPGRLPHELSPETMLQPHDSFPYNPVIAQALYKMTYLENWGGGGGGSGPPQATNHLQRARREKPNTKKGKRFFHCFCCGFFFPSPPSHSQDSGQLPRGWRGRANIHGWERFRDCLFQEAVI